MFEGLLLGQSGTNNRTPISKLTHSTHPGIGGHSCLVKPCKYLIYVSLCCVVCLIHDWIIRSWFGFCHVFDQRVASNITAE